VFSCIIFFGSENTEVKSLIREVFIQSTNNNNETENIEYKEFGKVAKELFRIISSFDKGYIIQTCGIEGYLYLLFQRKLIILLFLMTTINIPFSFLSTFINEKLIRLSNKNSLMHIALLNNLFLNDFSTILHVISLFFFTILHFNLLTQMKREARNIYFERYVMMSQTKEMPWLRCRTLLLSGIPHYERNGKTQD